MIPIGPAPVIKTSSPRISYDRAVCTALPNGSKKAAIFELTSSSIDHTFDSGSTRNSAKHPAV